MSDIYDCKGDHAWVLLKEEPVEYGSRQVHLCGHCSAEMEGTFTVAQQMERNWDA